MGGFVDQAQVDEPLPQWRIDFVVEDVSYIFRQPVDKAVGRLVLSEVRTAE